MIDSRLAAKTLVERVRWVLEAGFRGEKKVLAQEGIDESPKVLDVGCGAGTFSGLFHPQGYLGIDLDPVALACAKRRHPRHRYVLAQGGSLALASETFHAVIVGGVIHHMGNPDAIDLIREIHRVLVPGGSAVIWEDVYPESRLNVIGRLVNRFDPGANIREPEAYADMVERVFGPARRYRMRSGVCNYVVLVPTKAGG